MKATKIDWCDSTINPVVGCGHNCEYCYARKMNGRKLPWSIPDFTKPQFYPARLAQLYSKTPKAIFMDSMSDIAFWAADWKRRIFDAIRDNPQHKYIFLTKCPTVYIKDCPKAANIFLGASMTGQNLIPCVPPAVDFLSIEPLLSPVSIADSPNIKAVIIGAETGNRIGKIIPQRQWIDDIVRECDARHIVVYMKDSKKQILQGIMGADFRQDPLPWRTQEGQ